MNFTIPIDFADKKYTYGEEYAYNRLVMIFKNGNEVSFFEKFQKLSILEQDHFIAWLVSRSVKDDGINVLRFLVRQMKVKDLDDYDPLFKELREKSGHCFHCSSNISTEDVIAILRKYGITEESEQLDAYIKKLNITTAGERYVLEHILKRDRNRDILLQDIEMIKYNARGYSGLVGVKCRTRNGSYSFSVAHLGGKGWSTNDLEEQKSYISRDLYHKID